jgi:uncharacterized membrane protein YeaQ/YmgE (transglycosylase-associated protein family)
MASTSAARSLWDKGTLDKGENGMSLEQLVVWIIVGGIAGVLADALVKGIKLDLVGAIVVGILGALIGGWLFDALSVSIGSGFINDVITSLVGAVVLLVVLRALRRA